MTESGYGIKIQLFEIGLHYTVFRRRFTTFSPGIRDESGVFGAKTNSFLRNLG